MSEGIPQSKNNKKDEKKSPFQEGYEMDVREKEAAEKIKDENPVSSEAAVGAIAASGATTFLGGVGKVFNDFKNDVAKEKSWIPFRNESRLEEVFPNGQITPEISAAYKKLTAPQKAAFNELSKEEKINYFNTLAKKSPEKKNAVPQSQKTEQKKNAPEAPVKAAKETPEPLAKLFGDTVPKSVRDTYDRFPPKKREEYLAHVAKNVGYYKKLLAKEKSKVSRPPRQNQKEKTEKTPAAKEDAVSAKYIQDLRNRLDALSREFTTSKATPDAIRKIKNIEENIKKLEATQVPAPDRTPNEYKQELNAHLLAYKEHLKQQEELKKKEEKINSGTVSKKIIEELREPKDDIIVEENKGQERLLKEEEINRLSSLGKLSNESIFLARKDAAQGRRDELDERSRSLGLEGHFRKLGEKYAKIGWKQKLGVGVALGLGAAALSPVSFPAAMACMSGLFAQRVAGMAHAYIGAEKFLKFNAEKREGSTVAKFIDKKEVAILGAALYSIGMGAGISYAVKEVSQHIGDMTGFNLHELNTFIGHIKEDSAEYTKAMSDWVKNYWSFNHPGVPSQPAHEFKITPLPIEKAPDADLLAAHGKVIPPAVSTTIEHNPVAAEGVSGGSASEMPSVGAVKGQGYEYMLKQLWERLHEQGVKIPEGSDASNSYPNSDLAKLLAADKDSIGKVAHQIASQSGHGFNADGSSIKIGLDTVMTIDADGQVHIAEAHHPAAEAVKSAGKSIPQLFKEPDAIGKTDSLGTKIPPGESASAHAAPGVKSVEEVLKSNQEFENLGKHAPAADSAQSAPEAAKSFEKTIPIVRETIHLNSHGLSVGIDTSGSYVDSDGRHVVFGGSAEERIEAAKAIVEKNHDVEVYFNSGDADGHLKKVFYDPGSNWVLNPTPSEIKIVETSDNPIRPDDLTESYTPTDSLKDNYNSLRNTALEQTEVSPELEVNPGEPHLYAGSKGELFAYGGTPAEKANLIQDFLLKNPGAVVFSSDDHNEFRIPWYLEGKEAVPGMPMKDGGFLGFGQSWMHAPGPDEFKSVVPFTAETPAPTVAPEIIETPVAEKESVGVIPPEKELNPVAHEEIAKKTVPETKAEAPATEKTSAGQGIQKEKIAPMPDKLPVPNIDIHKFDVIKTGSLEGKFEYSPDGKNIQSLSLESSTSQDAGEALLVGNYVEILNEKRVAPLVQQSVLGRATNIAQHLEALDALKKEGADNTPQADFIRKIIKRIINRDIKLFGQIFKSDVIKNIK